MPLPTAPSKRADRLTAKDFDAPARASQRPLRKAPQTEPLAPVAAAVRSKPAQPEAVKKPQTAALTHAPVATPAVAAPPPRATVSPVRRAKKTAGTGPTKLFVLDTNVLMHDPMCLFRF